ncbi:SH2 domain-containing protein 2A [Rhinoderma darwinii]|uniref:SH2 domain-containing protein 2A n=1 Tax=Rhinoderma darwinii TaxID=43563 RepID=UPI003F66B0A5
MAYDYQKDFPPILFSTFKPIPQTKDVPSGHTGCHEETSQSTETTIEAKNKSTSPSPTNSEHKGTSRNTGSTLKDQTYEWFERTQRKKLLKNGQFPDWFHGFITRIRAEETLQDKPLGCFLIRFCESRIGYVLSYRGAERCRHFILNQLEDEQYVIEGEESVHPSLEDLVNHYCRFPVEPYKEMLTTAGPMNPFKHNVSSLSQDAPQDASDDGKIYSRIYKQNKSPPDSTLLLATSPKERNKVFCEGKIPLEYGSPSFVRKVPAIPRKEPIPSQQDLEPLFAYAPIKKSSGDYESDIEVATTYNPSEKTNTYPEPDLWDRPREENINDSEDIAFYAVGRGSCKDNLENVYTEVDISSITLCNSRAAKSRHAGLSTLPHPTSKPVKHKTTTFHSSFRSHKSTEDLQEDPRMGHFSSSNRKPHPTIQLDEPKYGKSHLQNTRPHPDEENIYEKIPENCVTTSKNNHPGRKAR